MIRTHTLYQWNQPTQCQIQPCLESPQRNKPKQQDCRIIMRKLWKTLQPFYIRLIFTKLPLFPLHVISHWSWYNHLLQMYGWPAAKNRLKFYKPSTFTLLSFHIFKHGIIICVVFLLQAELNGLRHLILDVSCLIKILNCIVMVS